MSNFWIYLLGSLAVILVLGMVYVAVRYTLAIRAARRHLKSLGSRVIETACGSIEYARMGKGYPVLVVHGAFGGFDQGLWVAKSFDISKYQLISVSRFGFLQTPLPPGATLNLQADAFACLLDALDIRQAAVFAISAGSTSAIRFAARHPGRVSALVLLGPDAPGETYMAMPPRFVFDTLMRSDFLYWVMVTFFGKKVQTWAGLVPKGYVLTPEYAATVNTLQSGDLPISRRMDGEVFSSYTLYDEFKASVTADSPYPLNKIQTTTLVVSAADDPISLPANVHALTEQMPNARLFSVPDGGHLFFGHTEEVRAEIAQFLDSQVVEPQPVRDALFGSD